MCIIAILLVGAMLAACASPATPEPAPEQAPETPTEEAPVTEEPPPVDEPDSENIRIGVIPADSGIQFFQLLASGMEQAGVDLGVEVHVQFSGRQVEEELRLVEHFIAQGYDGIVLQTVDSEAITGAMQRAQEAGVTFVAVDTVPARPEMAASTVSSDNYSGGVALGNLVQQLLPDGGNAIMIRFQHESIAMNLRYDGIEDALRDSNVNIVATVSQDGSRDDTVVQLAPMLTAHPDIDIIINTQGDPAIGSLTAVTAAGMQDDVIIVSYDIENEVAQAILGGSAIVGGVAQFPYEMGYLSVVKAYRAIRGQPVDNMLLLPVLEVTLDVMQEFLDDSTGFLERHGNFNLRAFID